MKLPYANIKNISRLVLQIDSLKKCVSGKGIIYDCYLWKVFIFNNMTITKHTHVNGKGNNTNWSLNIIKNTFTSWSECIIGFGTNS